MNDDDQVSAPDPGSLDGDPGSTVGPIARPQCIWLSGVLNRLFTLEDLADPPRHGGWRA